MSKKTGTITEIFDGTVASGRSAGKPFKAITLESGEKLTAFEQQLPFVEGLNIGDKATFEVTTASKPGGSGDYINIAGETAVDVSAPPVIQTAGFHPSDGLPVDPSTGAKPAEERKESIPPFVGSKDVSIARMSALKSAVEFIIGTLGGTVTVSVGDVLVTAKEFYKYISGGK